MTYLKIQQSHDVVVFQLLQETNAGEEASERAGRRLPWTLTFRIRISFPSRV